MCNQDVVNVFIEKGWHITTNNKPNTTLIILTTIYTSGYLYIANKQLLLSMLLRLTVVNTTGFNTAKYCMPLNR